MMQAIAATQQFIEQIFHTKATEEIGHKFYDTEAVLNRN
jgi:hypothetical protein